MVEKSRILWSGISELVPAKVITLVGLEKIGFLSKAYLDFYCLMIKISKILLQIQHKKDGELAIPTKVPFLIFMAQ